jgi:hypothetical protein
MSEFFQYIRACIADPGVLAKNVTEDELCKHLTFIKEEAFLICDKLTRETGRLTKLVVVFDMKVSDRERLPAVSECWFLERFNGNPRQIDSKRHEQKFGDCSALVSAVAGASRYYQRAVVYEATVENCENDPV